MFHVPLRYFGASPVKRKDVTRSSSLDRQKVPRAAFFASIMWGGLFVYDVAIDVI